MSLKQDIRSLLNFLHLDLTKNLTYDRLTKSIMKKVVKSDSNCIDIGCHKGDVLELILSFAPKGSHYAFEPIPDFYYNLKKQFPTVEILPYALSNKNGKTKFKFVKNAPAYSGIKERKYDIETPEIEEIKVQLKKLDDVIPVEHVIDFIKIDVEGGEFDVLKGSERILRTNKPIVVFESGLGASEYYGTIPEELFQFFENIDYELYLLKSFVKTQEPLSEIDFNHIYLTNKEYYFVAKPKS